MAPRLCSALRNLAKGMIVDAQKSNRSRCLPRRGLDQRARRAQTRERESIPAARLLDQGRVAQGLEDARGVASHVIGDRQNKTGRKLPERSPCAGKGWRVREKFLAGK